MKELFLVLKEHRIIPIVIFVLLLFFIAWSVFQVTTKSDNSREKEPKAVGVKIDEKMKPTDEQLKLIRNYTEEDEKIVDVLKSNIWTDEFESASLTFTETIVTEQQGADSEIKNTYAITAILDDRSKNENSNYEYYILALQMKNEVKMIKLSRIVAVTQNNETIIQDWQIEGQYEYSSIYKKKDVTQLEITNMSKEVSALFVNENVIKDEVTTYVEIHFPQATKATWVGSVEANQDEHIVKTKYRLDVKNNTEIEVIYHTDTKEIEVK